MAGENGQRVDAFAFRLGRKGIGRKVVEFQVDLSGRYRANEFMAHVVRLSNQQLYLIHRMNRKRETWASAWCASASVKPDEGTSIG
jgi:hypothetical protein